MRSAIVLVIVFTTAVAFSVIIRSFCARIFLSCGNYKCIHLNCFLLLAMNMKM